MKNVYICNPARHIYYLQCNEIICTNAHMILHYVNFVDVDLSTEIIMRVLIASHGDVTTAHHQCKE